MGKKIIDFKMQWVASKKSKAGGGGNQKRLNYIHPCDFQWWDYSMAGVYKVERLLISFPPLPLIFFPAMRRVALQNQ